MKRISFDILQKKLGPQGFTLAETLVSTLIFSFIMAASLFIITAGSEAWRANSLKSEQGDELRKAMIWITSDLLLSGSSVIVDVPADGVWRTTMTFKVVTGVTSGSITWGANNIQYLLSGSNPVQLQRKNGAATRIIALNIETLQFRRLSTASSVVEVQLTAKNSSLPNNKWRQFQNTVTFKVRMRNS